MSKTLSFTTTLGACRKHVPHHVGKCVVARTIYEKRPDARNIDVMATRVRWREGDIRFVARPSDATAAYIIAADSDPPKPFKCVLLDVIEKQISRRPSRRGMTYEKTGKYSEPRRIKRFQGLPKVVEGSEALTNGESDD